MRRPSRSQPPLLGRFLLRLSRLRGRREQVEADFDEVFLLRVAERGWWYAATRYCADVASLWFYGTGRVVVAVAARDRGLNGVVFDVRFAARMFRRHLGAVSVAVVGLALAIGVSTAVFGWLNAAMFAAFGVPEPSTVVQVRQLHSNGRWSGLRLYEDFRQLRPLVQTVKLEAWWREMIPLGEADPETVRVMPVSGGFFNTLGVGAAVGRVLTDADDREGAPPVAVLNHVYWSVRFGGDEEIVGQTVRLMGTAFEVVGVAADGFNGPQPVMPPAFWVPLASHGVLRQLAPGQELHVWLVGRLAEGTTREQAEAELNGAEAGMAVGPSGGEAPQAVRALLLPAVDVFSELPGRMGWFLGTVAALLALVLVLACANAANVLLAGALGRRREVGVRLALGASRWRVVRQLLTESLMLSMLSGGLGVLLAYWMVPLLAAVIEVPTTVDLAPDLRVVGFLTVVTLAAGLATGLAPARFGASGDLIAPLNGEAGVAVRRRGTGRTRSTLIAVQAVAAIVLLVFAALLTRAVVHVSLLDLGFDADSLVTVTPRFDAGRYDATRAADYWDRVLTRVGQMPDIESSALAAMAPFGGGYGSRRVQRDGRQIVAYFNETTADYFNVAGLPIVRGRTYTAEEVARGASVAVISEGLARALWDGEEALGATLEMGREDIADALVIGVVADAVTFVLDFDAAVLYQPLSPDDALRGQLVLRVVGDAAAVAQQVIEAIRAVDPNVLPTARPVRDGVDQALQLPRGFATMAAVLGALALGLAATGVFGVTAFAVEQRTGEIGVRLAIGANSGDVIRLMLRDSLRPVMAGLAVGLLVVIAASRVLGAALYGVDALDPVAILAAVTILLSAALVAAALPARRAAQLDPAAVLRRG